MASRAANATIKGYYYQFDTSILKILDLTKNTDSITIEGIEDIDIDTSTEQTAIQCKYLSKSKFINSAVREPITLMLDHYVRTQSNFKYNLYAHFEDEIGGSEKIISLSLLKEILTYTESKIQKCHYKDNGITDQQLNEFLLNFNFIFGLKFEDQQKEVIKKLKKEFNCTDFEADSLYYNNALRVVIDRAILPHISQRVINKGDFKKAIDKSKLLINEWYIKLRSKITFLENLSKTVAKNNSNNPTKSKYIFIGSEIIESDNSEYNLVTLIENLIYKYYRLNHSLRNSKPITLIIDSDKSKLIELKKSLIKNEIVFNDGLEEIQFDQRTFNLDPIINVSQNKNRISKSSFSIKLISKETFHKHIDNISSPQMIFNFSDSPSPYNHAMEYQLYDIKYCENIKDIAAVIL